MAAALGQARACCHSAHDGHRCEQLARQKAEPGCTGHQRGGRCWSLHTPPRADQAVRLYSAMARAVRQPGVMSHHRRPTVTLHCLES